MSNMQLPKLYMYKCPICGSKFEDESSSLRHCLVCGAIWKYDMNGEIS